MTLEDMGKDARPAVSSLLTLLGDADAEVRTDACIALGPLAETESSTAYCEP